jgi:hypothetical protein
MNELALIPLVNGISKRIFTASCRVCQSPESPGFNQFLLFQKWGGFLLKQNERLARLASSRFQRLATKL